MKPMTVFLDPLDVLLFRDGRPRVLGDSHLMTGTFPPPPSALYGGFRSAVLAHKSAQFSKHDVEEDPAPVKATFDRLPADVKAVVGDWNSRTGGLSLGRVSLARINRERGTLERLFPLGSDLVKPKGKEDGALRLLTPQDRAGYVSSLPEALRPLGVTGSTEFMEPAGGYVSEKAFLAYLMNELDNPALTEKPISLSTLAGEEDRVSVSLMHKMEKGQTTRKRNGTGVEGMLFTSKMTRLGPDIGLLVEVDAGGMLPERGVLRLGAEMRAAAWHTVNATDSLKEPLVKAFAEKTKLRLVVTSPAPFAQGWIPDFLNPDTLKGSLHGIAVELKGATVGRYVNVGGWDMARNRPRDAQRAVPTGSVYYLTCKDGKAAELASRLIGTSLFSSDTESAKLGLGIVYPGIW